MEKKKILWIVIAVSAFMLIILIFALILYAPSRSTGTAIQQAATFTPTPQVSSNTNKIDPDSWVRSPESVPGLDNQLTPPQGNINLTIVNGDNAGAKYGTVDVTGLTKDTTGENAVATAPENTGLKIPGQTENKTTVQTSVQTTVKTNTAKTEKATSSAKPVPVTPKATEKPVAKKTITVIEYWIQTGSFASKVNAEKARDGLSDRYLKAEIFTKDVSSSTTYRVRVGPYKSKTEADYWLGTVKEVPEFTGSYVSEVKVKK